MTNIHKNVLNQQKQYNQTLHSVQTKEDVTTTKLHIKRSLLECMISSGRQMNMRAAGYEKAKKRREMRGEKRCKRRGNAMQEKG